MKKVFLLIFAVCLLLSGCSCSHEWADANCLTPKTCSLCGETEGETLAHNWTDAACETPKTCIRCGLTEGEALGHNWSEANCTTPETCTLCGAVQGEPLPHIYGKLEFSEDSMFCTCEVCGTESDPMPRDDALYVQDHLPGTWIGYSTSQLTTRNEVMSETIHDSLEPYTLIIKPDGTFAANLGEHKTGTWAYRETSEDNGYITYYCDLHYDGDREDVIHSISYSEDIGVSILETYGAVILSRNFRLPSPELKAAESLILGTWYSTIRTTYQLNLQTFVYDEAERFVETDHSITFLEDGTFTAQFHGEKTGTWFCSHIYNSQWQTLYTYQFQFDGEAEVHSCIYDTKHGLSINFDQEGSPLDYKFFHTEADVEKFINGPEMIIGNWVSESMAYWPADSEESIEESTSAYSLTVNADGTFQGTLLTEVSGTWSYSYYDLERQCHLYLFSFDQYIYEEVFFTLEHDGIFYALLIEKDGSTVINMKKQ